MPPALRFIKDIEKLVQDKGLRSLNISLSYFTYSLQI